MHQESVIDHIMEHKIIRVGYDFFEPWNMLGPDGALQGFSVDVAKAFASDMGWEVEFVRIPWENILRDLEKKKIDVVISGLEFVPHRFKNMLYSLPYGRAQTALLANQKLASARINIQDYNWPDVTIIVRENTSYEALAHQLFPKANIRTISTDTLLIRELLEGKASAAIMGYIGTKNYQERYSNRLFIPSNKPIDTGITGMGIPLGEYRFLHIVNSWILNKQARNWFDNIRQQWFERKTTTQ